VASIFRPGGKGKYVILYNDENGKRRKKAGTTDKGVTQRIANDLENKVALRKQGLIDPKAEAYRDHAARPLSEHLAAWVKSIEAKSATPKHVELFTARARRVVGLVMGAKPSDIAPAGNTRRPDVARFEAALAKWVATARLSDLTAERVQVALATLKAEGRSLETCNHYRAAIMSFSKWLYDTHRAKEDALRGVKGYNSKEDRRHDRRTVSLEELYRLIEAAQRGRTYMGMTGPARALCYRLAVATGLRYSEIATIKPESFDWKAPTVIVAAAYTKNGQTATMHLPNDLVDDLAAYVAPLPFGMPIFQLPEEKGARMLRYDLKVAGIPYCDASGLFFDFHATRCQLATLADAAGVSPRVVQRLMRHSSLELTGRYTKPRVVDIEAAAAKLPSLKPANSGPAALAATGTDPNPGQTLGATGIATQENDYASNVIGGNVFASNAQRCPPPPPPCPPPKPPPMPPLKPPPIGMPPPRKPLPSPAPPMGDPRKPPP